MLEKKRQESKCLALRRANEIVFQDLSRIRAYAAQRNLLPSKASPLSAKARGTTPGNWLQTNFSIIYFTIEKHNSCPQILNLLLPWMKEWNVPNPPPPPVWVVYITDNDCCFSFANRINNRVKEQRKTQPRKRLVIAQIGTAGAR